MSSQNEARRPSGCMPGPVIQHHGGLSTRVGAIWSHGLPCGIGRCGTQVPSYGPRVLNVAPKVQGQALSLALSDDWCLMA